MKNNYSPAADCALENIAPNEVLKDFSNINFNLENMKHK